MEKLKIAIVGPGNIGSDLMIKVIRHSEHLEMYAMVGIDPNSEGLARAKRMGYVTTAKGFCLLYTSPSPRDGLLSRMPSSA